MKGGIEETSASSKPDPRLDPTRLRGALSNERPYRDLRNVVANYPFERSHRFAGSSRIPATETIHVFRCGVGDTQLRGRSAADASSLTHPRCCDGGRPIGDARVPQIPSAPGRAKASKAASMAGM